MTFIISEDEALRDRLTGMTVSDSKNPIRPVGVWFGQPDPEIRAQSFPFVTVDLIDMSEATERVMSGKSAPWYLKPDDLSADEGWDTWYPTPINLDYQVTTFARQPRHDRQILEQMLGGRLPVRFGFLEVTERIVNNVPNTTVRRLDLLNVVKRDTTEAGKRMFMNAFTVRVSSEIASPFDLDVYQRVREVNVTGPQSPTPDGPTPIRYEHIRASVTALAGTP